MRKTGSQLVFPFAEWRSIPFAPAYEVSAAGTVRRTLPGRHTYVGKVIRPTRHRFGYPRIKLTIDGKHQTFELHILVLTTFRGPKPFPKAEGRHLDGDPSNNHVSNLVWATHRENEADKKRHGTLSIGTRNGAAKLNEIAVANIRRDYAELKSLVQTAAKYGVAFQTVSKIVNRRRWGHVS